MPRKKITDTLPGEILDVIEVREKGWITSRASMLDYLGIEESGWTIVQAASQPNKILIYKIDERDSDE